MKVVIRFLSSLSLGFYLSEDGEYKPIYGKAGEEKIYYMKEIPEQVLLYARGGYIEFTKDEAEEEKIITSGGQIHGEGSEEVCSEASEEKEEE